MQISVPCSIMYGVVCTLLATPTLVLCCYKNFPTAGGRELILDYIVERKRMDDLASSIVDRRFHEQKFRLKNCGIGNGIYLVEEYGSSQHLSIAEDTLQQAITNTQVVDGFYVKRTRDSKESAAYLTLMTRYMQSIYRNKTLRACTRTQMEDRKNSVSASDVSASQATLMTFQSFNNSAVKTRALTIKELFGKQMIQLAGMTAEKAAAILDRYPTPYSLFRAYDMCSSEKEKENLLKEIKFGSPPRSVGANLSQVVFMLYCRRGPLS